ncbi:hypothetical protein RchiOBHm_Chr4g0403641 [Rosa chinensis]|uniref:Uncharacterized protein n=1 Tax=Rosa chinensis TaxID=74649 RepID=A0A2P6QTM7_ROSCH|nr:hypothetical protein RchiOBHm_Chr4g0403641 [Rosa chinensis]
MIDLCRVVGLCELFEGKYFPFLWWILDVGLVYKWKFQVLPCHFSIFIFCKVCYYQVSFLASHGI